MLARRLSPIHEQLAQLNPRWITLCGMPVPADFGDPERERRTASLLSLCDVSAVERIVVKGPRAAEFLRSQAVWVPQRVYAHQPQSDGAIVVRSGGAEFFIENGWQAATVERLLAVIGARAAGVYGISRQDVSLFVSGSAAIELFSQTCSYNFGDSGFQFVMTQIAGVSCAVLPRQLGAMRVWQLWADGTYGPYLWDTLFEIVREVGGDAVGLECFVAGERTFASG
jgi:sarcosine oxidase subunit gamma